MSFSPMRVFVVLSSFSPLRIFVVCSPMRVFVMLSPPLADRSRRHQRHQWERQERSILVTVVGGTCTAKRCTFGQPRRSGCESFPVFGGGMLLARSAIPHLISPGQNHLT